MIGVFGYFANPCKWVHIGCKSKQNFDTFIKSVVIISSSYRYLSTPCIATKLKSNIIQLNPKCQVIKMVLGFFLSCEFQ